jgi:putative (di)nucleoside polyphosphate hydrolase
MSDKKYRPCVGIMLINAQGLVFVGSRANKALREHVAQGHEWQMPQGGIDAGEDPYLAALRELAEETNVSVTLLAEASDWFTYDLPVDIAQEAWKGRYAGQTQKWFALRFTGDESEINILSPAGGHKPEFDSWKWVPMADLPAMIIPFKRPVYENVVQEFARFVDK